MIGTSDVQARLESREPAGLSGRLSRLAAESRRFNDGAEYSVFKKVEFEDNVV